jgi:putative ABC transport system permease protein
MLGNAFLLAFRQIRRNPLRSLLTVLGIVIGVAAVITMVTVGNGATEAVKEQIESFGSNQLMLRKGQRMGPGGAAGAPSSKTLKRSKIRLRAFCRRRLSRSAAPLW